MDVYVSYQSALEHWRISRALPKDLPKRKSPVSIPTIPPSDDSIHELGLTPPVHTMISKPGARRGRISQIQHVCTRTLPVGSFMRIREGLQVSSPEFMILQMAELLPLLSLIKLCYEFCGTYSMPDINDPDPPEWGFYQREQLTTVKKLYGLASKATGFSGHRKMLRATNYVIDGSASPMETASTMMLTLPYKLGGFGLDQPLLNYRIDPVKAAKQVYSKEYYVVDLYWPEYKLVVEYDSERFHANSQRMAEDSKKRNALASMGITVISVTKQQIYDRYEFEKVARVIAGYLGKRLVYKEPAFSTAHRALRDLLL